jgi:hypothetical protein
MQGSSGQLPVELDPADVAGEIQAQSALEIGSGVLEPPPVGLRPRSHPLTQGVLLFRERTFQRQESGYCVSQGVSLQLRYLKIHGIIIQHISE